MLIGGPIGFCFGVDVVEFAELGTGFIFDCASASYSYIVIDLT